MNQKPWTDIEVVLATIYGDLSRGSAAGLSAWDLLRRFQTNGYVCPLDTIVGSLHELKRKGYLMIADNHTVPFRYVITQSGCPGARDVAKRLVALDQEAQQRRIEQRQ